MVRPAHSLVTFSGVFGSTAAPVEQWSFGIAFPQNRWTALSATATVFQGYWAQRLAPLHKSNVVLTKVRISQIDASGHVVRGVDGSYSQADWNGASAGTSVFTQQLPPQCAVAVSLLSQRPDATGKGRIFLPTVAVAVDPVDLRMSAGDASNIVTSVGLFVSSIGAYNPANTTFSGGDPRAVVVSSKGYLSTVTQVRVGRAIDTMRSRRRALQEGYQSVNVTAV